MAEFPNVVFYVLYLSRDIISRFVYQKEMKGTAHNRLPKDGTGSGRMDVVKRLRERLDGLRDLLHTYEAVPMDQRDKKAIQRLNKHITSTRSGLRSAGENFY